MSRKPLILLFIIATFTRLFAQPDSVDETSTLIQAEQMPYFVGCTFLPEGSVEKRTCSNQTLVSFIAKNLEIPAQTDETGIVYVQFSITETGKVTEARLLSGLTAAHNEAALKVVQSLPDWEPAKKDGANIKVKMTLPIRFKKKDDTEFSNGFRLSWGKLKTANVPKDVLIKLLQTPVTVRDDVGNTLEINELLFERERDGKFADAESNGTITPDMQSLVKKLKVGDAFTVTATVQKKGQFYYVDKTFKIEKTE